MNFDEFKRILTTFADKPADVDISKGQLLVQIHDDVITGEIHTKEGVLFVKEDDTAQQAYHWLIKRIARLPQLAGRILDYIPEESSFVTPAGQLLDQLESNPGDNAEVVLDTVDAVREVLSRRTAGTSSVLYLTSDAGEGKTTLINKIARVQATAYKNKETDWLLLPIMLGGRPFLRFDDIVIGELARRFRFQFFYYDAFIELVKLGVIVPAFDGFEEMFIESSSGEALSALGNMMNTLRSSGSVLISARKAYFEYKSFATQARLYDALESNSVSFSKLALHRWNREQFILYCKKRGIPDGESIFRDVSLRLSNEHHPLLTRAVLVKRLLDIAESLQNREHLLEKLGNAPHDYFFQFVDAIIAREVNEKWIDRSGQPARPLITSDEHHELLSLIAQEMWLMNTEALNDDVLDLLSELFSDAHDKSPTIARQIKERLKQHALIASVSGSKSTFAFDHEEFRNFFLGQALGRRLVENSETDLRQLLSKGVLPQQSFDASVQFLRHKNYDLIRASEILQGFSKSDIVASFTRENCGGLIIRLIDGYAGQNLSISSVNFPQHSLRGEHLSGITFADCYFQSTSLKGASISSCHFVRCRFDSLELGRSTRIQNSSLTSCEVVSVISPGHDNRIYDPVNVSRVLINAGFSIHDEEGTINSQGPSTEPEEELLITERALRTFIRSTQIQESILQTKLGVKFGLFSSTILPKLLRSGVLIQMIGAGTNNNPRYRLGVQMREIDEAITQSSGNFDRFLEHFSGER